jgi:hypothetical protein
MLGDGWWLDPVVGLVIASVAVNEGVEAWRGEGCCVSSPLDRAGFRGRRLRGRLLPGRGHADRSPVGVLAQLDLDDGFHAGVAPANLNGGRVSRRRGRRRRRSVAPLPRYEPVAESALRRSSLSIRTTEPASPRSMTGPAWSFPPLRAGRGSRFGALRRRPSCPVVVLRPQDRTAASWRFPQRAMFIRQPLCEVKAPSSNGWRPDRHISGERERPARPIV